MAGKVASCPVCKMDFKMNRDWQKVCSLTCQEKSRYTRNKETRKQEALLYYHKNKEEIKKNRKETIQYVQWKAKLKANFNLTPEEYMYMFDIQKGQCKICEVSLKAIHRNTHVDHNHNTGKVRGLLCANCNLGLGHFKDSTFFLTAAISYLGEK